jgi:hypothetical protein
MARVGLVQELGVENVISLAPHPTPLTWAAPYSNGPSISEDEAAARIEEFDLVLLASVMHAENTDRLARLVERVGRPAIKRLALLDGSDAYDWLPTLHVERFAPEVVFKREVLGYKPFAIGNARLLPCPLSVVWGEFAHHMRPRESPAGKARDIDVVFLGGQNAPVTDGVTYKAPLLEAVLRVTKNVVHERENDLDTYLDLLARAKIAVSCRGHGLESIRCYEIFATPGTMLVTDRWPLRREHDFVEGEHWALYSSPAELESVIRRYLGDDQARERVAMQGYRHTQAHHTSQARARQMLAALSIQP